MKSFMPKVLFYYSAIAAFVITVSTIFSSQSLAPVIFATLFLPVTAYFVIEFFKEMHSLLSPKPVEGSDIGTGPKKAEFIIMIAIFLLLLGVGIRNIMVSAGKTQNIDAGQAPAPSATPLIFKVGPSATPSAMLTINITDGSPSINIRQKPSIYSEKIGEAKEGDTFESLGVNSGWYEIKLASGSGFISAKYVSR